MTDGTPLQHLIHGLPAAFAAAPRPTALDACPCCTRPAELSVLLHTPRERLTADELTYYATSVLNTVGSPADFRYFAPRILQLALTTELTVPDLELVGNKLARAGWQEWPEAGYLRRLLDALWVDVLHNADEWWDAEAVLCALAAAGDRAPAAFTGRLAEWELLVTPVAVERLYEFAVSGGLEPQNAFWDRQGAPYQAFVDWLRGPGLQLAVESAILRVDDPTQLEQLITVHDILTT
ncbi:hypothetical protein ABTZ03_18015 [Kitasatospora sp. NPDC096077]|uniref:hypothetical protein n=1 Tax=Kitasatospora sp. NPDC096077 TaxID=3155544 RepID=UPI00332A8A1F